MGSSLVVEHESVVDHEARHREEAARARRAARRAERASQPPPERDAAYDGLALRDLRALRAELDQQESQVSYWRRIIQARLDVVRGVKPDGDPVADLTRVLVGAQSAVHRLAHVDVRPVDDVPPLPDLAELWARQVDRDDPVARALLEDDLVRAEGELSAFRHELHRRIDGVTRELIARYRDQPVLALEIIPGGPASAAGPVA